MQFIDQEYARYNYRGFDIGNHFCECVVLFFVSPPPHSSLCRYLGFDNYDYDKFPSRHVQEHFVHAYLKHLKGSSDHSHATIERLLLESEAFALLANVHWGLWSLYQSKVSDNRFNFDYLLYAKQRLVAFYTHREAVYDKIRKSCATGSK
jgi:thiamine kinase-like enzyme